MAIKIVFEFNFKVSVLFFNFGRQKVSFLLKFFYGFFNFPQHDVTRKKDYFPLSLRKFFTHEQLRSRITMAGIGARYDARHRRTIDERAYIGIYRI
jgi:hypothetical protein